MSLHKSAASESLLIHVAPILSKHLEAKDTIILAVSGGPDSMSLLNLCIKILGNKRIVAAHFNHHVRAESFMDQKLVEAFCKKQKIAFEVGSKNVLAEAKRTKRGVEETGRILRYSFLEKVRAKRRAKLILTAQHADDQIETILLHIIRGTNLHGLTGMREREKKLLRPLLAVRKQELLEYAKRNKIPFAIDATNLKTDTSRNLLRLRITPLLEKINPGLVKTLLNSAALFTDLENDLQTMAQEFLGNQTKTKKARTKKIAPLYTSLPVSLQREVLKTLYIQAHSSTEGLYSPELEEVRRFILSSKTGKRKRFGKKLELRTNKKRITIHRTTRNALQ